MKLSVWPVFVTLLMFFIPEISRSNTCIVTNLAEWNGLSQSSNCSIVDFNGSEIQLDSTTSSLRLNVALFPARITLRNGIIRGVRSSNDDCIEVLHSDIELRNLEINSCGRNGIQVGNRIGSQDISGRKIYMENLKISDVKKHGINVGRHNHDNPVTDYIRVTKSKIWDIGVDGIAGSLGASGVLDIDTTEISMVDQRAKEFLDYNPQHPETFCNHADIGSAGGDCVHLQPVNGIVNISNNQCDHTDVPTKNGFILQNQYTTQKSGTINIDGNLISMDRTCLDLEQYSSHNNIRPNGIQLENIENIRLSKNKISDVFNGGSLNGNWTKAHCSIQENEIVGGIPPEGQDYAGVRFSGPSKNCNNDLSNSVPVVLSGLPVSADPPQHAERIVFKRTDKAEYWWLTADKNQLMGRRWVDNACGHALTSMEGIKSVTGDWTALTEIASSEEQPLEWPPCKPLLYRRTDKDEYWWLGADSNNVLGRAWIHPDCGQILMNQSSLVKENGNWAKMVGMAPGGAPTVAAPCGSPIIADAVGNFEALVARELNDGAQSDLLQIRGSHNGVRSESMLLSKVTEFDQISLVLNQQLAQMIRLEIELLKLRREIAHWVQEK